MEILDGSALAKEIRETVATKVVSYKKEAGRVPGLAVILVGEDPASRVYVNMKKKACEQAKIYSIVHEMPEDISQEAIIDTIRMMNDNPNIDGILVQVPLPKHIDETTILETIAPHKDVDGFHPFNVGRLNAGLEGFVPCTPLGVMKMLEKYNIDPKGKNAVIVGASNIVGKPMASLLLNANATVTTCHIFTQDLKSHTINADILVVGVGKIDLITADMIKEGAIVIDIGINRTDEGKLVGDVAYDEVSAKSSFITPVPGGVGPMTIAMLLQNTLISAQQRSQG